MTLKPAERDVVAPRRPRVLIWVGHYLPGHRAGGPIRSVSRIVEMEKDAIEVFLVTRDHDLGQEDRYEVASSTSWVDVQDARVLYLGGALAPGMWRSLKNLVRLRPDVVYLNSVFSPSYSMVPLAMYLLSPCRPLVLVAPRGELEPGALAVKSAKKNLVRRPLRRLLRSRRVVWHASTEMEKDNIQTWVGRPIRRVVIASVPGEAPSPHPPEEIRRPGPLRVVWVSRIVPKKDLLRTIRIAGKAGVPMELSIYGPREDMDYWRECQEAIDALPDKVAVSYQGTLDAIAVTGVFQLADAFLFPTHGENFGHVIAESLSVGCPVITSDTTPWSELLASGGGVAASSDDQAIAYLRLLSGLTPEAQLEVRRRCWKVYNDWFWQDMDRRPRLFTEALHVSKTET